MKFDLYKNCDLIVPELEPEQISALIGVAPKTVINYAKTGKAYQGIWTFEQSIPEEEELSLRKRWDKTIDRIRRAK